MTAFQISLKIESLYGLGRQAKKLQGFVWNFETFATEGSHLDNFPLKILKLDWVAFHSATFQLSCFFKRFNAYSKETYEKLAHPG